MIILLNLISLNNNIAQFDDRAVRRPRGATTARHDRAGWTGKNLILDEALHTWCMFLEGKRRKIWLDNMKDLSMAVQ